MQIISGKGNPLARAAARGEASQERAMQQAVAYDLDTLQRLAVTETTLSGTHTTDASLNSHQVTMSYISAITALHNVAFACSGVLKAAPSPEAPDPRAGLRVCSREIGKD